MYIVKKTISPLLYLGPKSLDYLPGHEGEK